MKNWLKALLYLLLILVVGSVGFAVFIVVVFSQIDVKPGIQPEPEQLKKAVHTAACYEGTQNQAVLNLRTDHTFDLNWTGAFGFDQWWLGTWKQQGDTLDLQYEGEINERLGRKVLLREHTFTPADTLANAVFYKGGCPSLN